MMCEYGCPTVVENEHDLALGVEIKGFDSDFIVIEEVDPMFDVGDIKKDIAFGVLFFIENLARKIIFFCFSEHARNHILVVLFVVLLESTSEMSYTSARAITLTSGAIPSAIF